MEVGGGEGSLPPELGIDMINSAKDLATFKAGLKKVEGAAISNGRRITNEGDINGSQGSLAVKDLIARYKELNQSEEAKSVSDGEKAEIILQILHLDAEASESFDEASTVSKAILAFKQAFSGVKHKQFKEMISDLNQEEVNQVDLDTMQVYLAARKVGKNSEVAALGTFTVLLNNPTKEESKKAKEYYSEWLTKADSKKLNELFLKEIGKAEFDQNGKVAQALKAMQEEVATAPNPPASNPPAPSSSSSSSSTQVPEPSSKNKQEGPNGPPPELPPRPTQPKPSDPSTQPDREAPPPFTPGQGVSLNPPPLPERGT